jgi:hypothetical protein
MTDDQKIKATMKAWEKYQAHVKDMLGLKGEIPWQNHTEMMRCYAAFSTAYGMGKGWVNEDDL